MFKNTTLVLVRSQKTNVEGIGYKNDQIVRPCPWRMKNNF